MKKKKNNKIFGIMVGFFLIIIAVNLFFILANIEALKNLKETKTEENIIKTLNLTQDPLSTNSFTEFNRNQILANEKTITLNNSCYKLNIFTNEYQTYAINNGLQGKIDVRPTMHDIMDVVLNNFNLELKDVRITETKGVHYYARAIFIQNNKILNIDLKASDAIALAVRTNSPIYVHNSILENSAEKIC